MPTPEGQQAIDVAKRVLDHADPDSEIVFLARNLLRAVELIDLGRENNKAVASAFETEIDRLRAFLQDALHSMERGGFNRPLQKRLRSALAGNIV